MKYLIILLLLFFSGCSTDQDKIQTMFQTDSAAQIKVNFHEIRKLIIKYKEKLDKRNPSRYNKENLKPILNDLQSSTNSVNLYSKKHKTLKNHVDYLKYAFKKDGSVHYRNDYLILGLYKMAYEAFLMEKKHKLTALSYDIKKLQKCYKNLKILQWKIKSDKDKKGDYLFLTWQNNWQVELLKRQNEGKSDYKELKELSYIKSGKESLLDPSNMSFEVLTAKMLLYIENSIKLLGTEPDNISLEALKSLVFLI